jgi:two-component system, OmpR family, sensor histidine kinase ChvG
MTDMTRPRVRWLRSIRLQAAALVLILIALPILIFAVLGNAEAERRLLMRNAVAETGGAIGAAIAPVLHDLWPADLSLLRTHLSRFTASDRSIKVLFRPKNSATGEPFYFVAAAPPISAQETESERQQLLRLGILPGRSEACTARLPNDRDASLLVNGTEVLTSATSVEGQAGCWVVVIATSEHRVLGAIEAMPYWERPEVRIAIGIYAVMALLIAAIFTGVWRGLLRFRRIALSSTQQPGFARTTGIPELATLATAFDSMVQRMRHGADMLRQAAEDNAHAFKGPIAVIRQVIEPRLRQTAVDNVSPRDSLRIIAIALERLDGLVQSARHLDTAAADLLEPKFSRVDLSALTRDFVRSHGAMSSTGQVRLEANIADGIAIDGQPEALEVILEALVDNAISFSPAGGRVLVQLEGNAGTASLAVRDDGPGVAPERLERIFDRYYTDRPVDAGNCTRSAAHFGIGLWLARQNAIGLGGSIAAANRAPRGLCVTVVVPLARP